MAIRYDRLWELLNQKGMRKKDLEQRAGISHYTMNKFKHGENLTTDILERVCIALNCSMNDILEIVPDTDFNMDKKTG